MSSYYGQVAYVFLKNWQKQECKYSKESLDSRITRIGKLLTFFVRIGRVKVNTAKKV